MTGTHSDRPTSSPTSGHLSGKCWQISCRKKWRVAEGRAMKQRRMRRWSSPRRWSRMAFQWETEHSDIYIYIFFRAVAFFVLYPSTHPLESLRKKTMWSRIEPRFKKKILGPTSSRTLPTFLGFIRSGIEDDSAVKLMNRYMMNDVWRVMCVGEPRVKEGNHEWTVLSLVQRAPQEDTDE